MNKQNVTSADSKEKSDIISKYHTFLEKLKLAKLEGIFDSHIDNANIIINEFEVLIGLIERIIDEDKIKSNKILIEEQLILFLKSWYTFLELYVYKINILKIFNNKCKLIFNLILNINKLEHKLFRQTLYLHSTICLIDEKFKVKKSLTRQVMRDKKLMRNKPFQSKNNEMIAIRLGDKNKLILDKSVFISNFERTIVLSQLYEKHFNGLTEILNINENFEDTYKTIITELKSRNWYETIINHYNISFSIKISFTNKNIYLKNTSKLLLEFSTIFEINSNIKLRIIESGTGSFWTRLKALFKDEVSEEEVISILKKIKSNLESKIDKPVIENEKLKTETEKTEKEIFSLFDEEEAKEYKKEIIGKAREERKSLQLDNVLKAIDIQNKISDMVTKGILENDSDIQIEINDILFIDKTNGEIVKVENPTDPFEKRKLSKENILKITEEGK